MGFNNLIVEVDTGIAKVVINRPHALNALNRETVGELAAVMNRLEADPNVAAIIVTGAGKAFVAGGDIKEMAAMSAVEAFQFARYGQKVLLELERMSKPVIAAVNGFALGGGLELALSCDFIYASAEAKFGLPEVTLGVIPGFGGTQNLSRLLGKGKAKELIFTGRIIDAEKARAWGIVNEVLAPEELLPRAVQTARAIAAVGPVAVASAKDAIACGLDMAKEDGFRYEAALFGVLFSGEERQEGMTAFIEKRRPVFPGRQGGSRSGF